MKISSMILATIFATASIGCSKGHSHHATHAGSGQQAQDQCQSPQGPDDKKACAEQHAQHHHSSTNESHQGSGQAAAAFDTAPPVGAKAFCPVTGGSFVVAKDMARSEYEGKHYAFCCAGCKPQFDAAPGKFLSK